MLGSSHFKSISLLVWLCAQCSLGSHLRRSEAEVNSDSGLQIQLGMTFTTGSFSFLPWLLMPPARPGLQGWNIREHCPPPALDMALLGLEPHWARGNCFLGAGSWLGQREHHSFSLSTLGMISLTVAWMFCPGGPPAHQSDANHSWGATTGPCCSYPALENVWQTLAPQCPYLWKRGQSRSRDKLCCQEPEKCHFPRVCSGYAETQGKSLALLPAPFRLLPKHSPGVPMFLQVVCVQLSKDHTQWHAVCFLRVHVIFPGSR